MSQTVVITGASAGVGRATAVEFAEHGAKVALIARGRAGLEAAAKEVEAAGGQAHIVQADVTGHAALESAADDIERELGPIDVWINNAMVTVYSKVEDLSPDEYQRVTEVTYLGSVYGTMVALARFRERDRGAIVQVGSALAYRGIPLQSAYCGAKAGLKNFIESLRTELMHERSNIQLTIVHLPGMNTPQFIQNRSHLKRQPQPVPPIFQPEVSAQGIYAATVQGRKEFWVGGPTVKTILGGKFGSHIADWYLAMSGESSQMTDQVIEPRARPDNLYEPVDDEEDLGTHGPFDDQAKDSSIQLELNERRKPLLAVAGVVTAAAGAAAWRVLRGAR